MVTWPDGVAVGCGAAVCDWPQAATARSATGSSLKRLTLRASARGLVKAAPPPSPGGSPVSLDRQHTIHRPGVASLAPPSAGCWIGFTPLRAVWRPTVQRRDHQTRQQVRVMETRVEAVANSAQVT